MRPPPSDAFVVGQVGAWQVQVTPWPNYNADGAGPWWNVRLVSGRRQFTLGYNPAEARLARGEALQRLQRRDARLERPVLEILRYALGPGHER